MGGPKNIKLDRFYCMWLGVGCVCVCFIFICRNLISFSFGEIFVLEFLECYYSSVGHVLYLGGGYDIKRSIFLREFL